MNVPNLTSNNTVIKYQSSIGSVDTTKKDKSPNILVKQEENIKKEAQPSTNQITNLDISDAASKVFSIVDFYA
jgi:hypothetical protein